MGRPEEAEAPAGGRGRFLLQLTASLAAGCAAATNGLALGWGVAATWQLRPDAAEADLRLTDGQRAWLNSILYLGTALGCLAGGRACTWFGPRCTMLYSLLPTALGNAVVFLAPSFAVLIAGRLIVGVSSGLPWAVYVLYISGTSSPRYRGMFSLLPDIICLGAIIGAIALGDILSWRWLAVVCGALTLVPTGILLVLLPDDPIWLLGRGRLADAKRAAVAFDLDLEVADASTTVAGEPAGLTDTLRLLTRRKNLVPLGIVMGLFFFSAFSGYMTILTYSLEFFRQAGLQLDASLCSMLFCAIRILAVLVTSQLVDRVGRRALLLSSCSGVSLCYVGMVLCYQLPALQPLTALPIVLLIAAGFIYSTALACIPFCLGGEIFPLRMRQLGGCLTTFGYCMFNMAATLAFPATLAALGASGLFLYHAVIMAAAFLFTLLVVPETKGLSLAAIETLFDGEANKARVAAAQLPPPGAPKAAHGCGV